LEGQLKVDGVVGLCGLDVMVFENEVHGQGADGEGEG
jgi:hypothetical protein